MSYLKLVTTKDYNPQEKTDSMTIPVGKDENGKLYAEDKGFIVTPNNYRIIKVGDVLPVDGIPINKSFNIESWLSALAYDDEGMAYILFVDLLETTPLLIAASLKLTHGVDGYAIMTYNQDVLYVSEYVSDEAITAAGFDLPKKGWIVDDFALVPAGTETDLVLTVTSVTDGLGFLGGSGSSAIPGQVLTATENGAEWKDAFGVDIPYEILKDGDPFTGTLTFNTNYDWESVLPTLDYSAGTADILKMSYVDDDSSQQEQAIVSVAPLSLLDPSFTGYAIGAFTNPEGDLVDQTVVYFSSDASPGALALVGATSTGWQTTEVAFTAQDQAWAELVQAYSPTLSHYCCQGAFLNTDSVDRFYLTWDENKKPVAAKVDDLIKECASAALPEGGTTGQILTKTDDGVEWAGNSSDLLNSDNTWKNTNLFDKRAYFSAGAVMQDDTAYQDGAGLTFSSSLKLKGPDGVTTGGTLVLPEKSGTLATTDDIDLSDYVSKTTPSIQTIESEVRFKKPLTVYDAALMAVQTSDDDSVSISSQIVYGGLVTKYSNRTNEIYREININGGSGIKFHNKKVYGGSGRIIRLTTKDMSSLSGEAVIYMPTNSGTLALTSDIDSAMEANKLYRHNVYISLSGTTIAPIIYFTIYNRSADSFTTVTDALTALLSEGDTVNIGGVVSSGSSTYMVTKLYHSSSGTYDLYYWKTATEIAYVTLNNLTTVSLTDTVTEV